MSRVAYLRNAHMSGQGLLKLLRTLGAQQAPCGDARARRSALGIFLLRLFGKYVLNVDCCQQFLLDTGSSAVDYHKSAVVDED